MNREDIIRMAQEAGFEHIAEADYWHPLFERFAVLVAAAEREACAQIAAYLLKMPENDVSAMIRRRGQV